MQLSNDYGYWFSGFVDGEGCFQVAQSKTAYWCRFSLTQRDDNAPLVYSLREQLALGFVTRVKARATSKPQVQWFIQKKQECVELVSILDQFPLRSKKADDYRMWKEAVMAWQLPEGYKLLPEFQTKIREARAYKPIPI